MAVFVGLSTIDLTIPESHSLKEKRQVTRSILDRIRHRFNVSACEVDHLDKWQKTTLAFAVVANDKEFIHECLMRIVEMVESDGRVIVENVSVEVW